MSLGLCLCVVDWRQAIAGSGGGVVSLSPRLERNMLVMIQRELEWPRELVSMMKDTTNVAMTNMSSARADLSTHENSSSVAMEEID